MKGETDDPSGGLWIRDPLVSWDPIDGETRDAGVVVKDGLIVERVALGATPVTPIQSTFDARSLVLVPGLINTHHHFYQTLTRAHRTALNKPLFPWLQSLYPVWSRLTPEMIDLSTRLAAVELMLSGCSTAVDHHYVFPPGLEDAIDLQAQAMTEIGMRAVLTRGSMSLGESTGGLPPDCVVQEHNAILRDSERLIDRWHDPKDQAMCQIVLAPCSPFSVTTELMRDTSELARRRGVLLHTHLAETEDENNFCLDTFGMRPVDYMESCDWLNERTWYAHGIHFSDAEIKRLGDAGCGVTHCPSSNMLLASGVCRVAELEQAGVRVGLGVDGSASNDGSNMIQEVRQAFLIQRLASQLSGSDANPVSHVDALRWATSGSAELIKRPELGRIAEGAAADIALFSLDEPRFSGSEDPLAALVLCGAQRVHTLLVSGDFRVCGSQPVGVDLAALQAAHQKAAQALWA